MDLSIKIQADVAQAKQNLELLKEELRDLKQSLSNNDKAIAGLNKQLAGLNTNTKEGAKAAAALKLQLSQLGTVNNTLVQGISKVKTEIVGQTSAIKTLATDLKKAENASSGFANGVGKAYSGLRTLANLIPGIGIGGLVGILAGPLVEALASVFGGLNKAAEATRNFREAFSAGQEGFVKATVEVSNLKIAIQQAKEGIISTDEALKLYNSTIGKTTGQVNSLAEAEDALTKNAAAYIKFTFLKAAANFALGKSAEEAFKAEEIRIKKAEEFKKVVTDTRVVGFGSTAFNAAEFEEDNKRIKRAQEKRKQDAIKVAEDASKAQLGIADKFFKDAEAIAGQFKFDFNAIPEPKPEAVKKIKEKIKKAFVAEKLILYPALIEISSDQILLDKEKAEKSFNDQLGKFKMVPIVLNLDEGDVVRKAREIAKQVEEINIKMGQTVKDTMNSAFASIGEGIADAIGEGKNLGQAIFGNLLKVIGAGIKQLGEAMIALGTAKIALEKFKFAPGIGTVIAGIAAVAIGALLQKAIPGFAVGVQNFAGGLAVVGERGPELVRLPRGSDVIPNSRLGGIEGGTQVFIPDVRLRGSDLVIAFSRASQTISRNG